MVGRLAFTRFEFWDWRERDMVGLAREAARRGLSTVIFSGNTFAEPLVDPEMHRLALAHFADSLGVARRVGAGLLVAHVGYSRSHLSHAMQWEAAVQGLRAAGTLAAEARVTLAVEPLNSTIDHPGYFLDSLPEALRLIREVDHPAVRLLVDIYHMRVMHGDLLTLLPAALPWVVHVHVADVPGRGEPGSGRVPWSEVLSVLRDSGYRGAIGLEFWPTGDPEDGLRRAVEVLTS